LSQHSILPYIFAKFGQLKENACILVYKYYVDVEEIFGKSEEAGIEKVEVN
jgi:hypothetical protein